MLTCHGDRDRKSLSNSEWILRVTASFLWASPAMVTCQQGFMSVLHCHLWPLTPSFPAHWAHSSDLSLWHTNSCVGGSEQSVDYYLPWLIDNRLQKNTNRESWGKKCTSHWHQKPSTSRFINNLLVTLLETTEVYVWQLFYGTGAFTRQKRLSKSEKYRLRLFIKYILFSTFWGGKGQKTHKFQTNALHLWKAYA